MYRPVMSNCGASFAEIKGQVWLNAGSSGMVSFRPNSFVIDSFSMVSVVDNYHYLSCVSGIYVLSFSAGLLDCIQLKQ